MSVEKSKRKQSSIEYDNTLFAIHNDAVNLITCNLGADERKKTLYSGYIKCISKQIMDCIFEITKNVKIANSIYPKYQSELETRRIHQDKAIGLCFDLLIMYQLALQTLGIKDDKHTEEIKHIIHEINCLKNWRKSDGQRFKNLG